MCRHPLNATEEPVKRLAEARREWRVIDMAGFDFSSHSIREFMASWDIEPTPPPPPPTEIDEPRSRIINIGDGVQVSNSDVAMVIQHAGVTRGEAVRALRRYDGDVIDSILMLTSPPLPTAPRPPLPPRDPMYECSDDQATTWFLQNMFNDSGYGWNGYSDLKYRMRNNMYEHEFWTHREFQTGSNVKLDEGYMSA